MWIVVFLGLLPFLGGFVYIVVPYLYVKWLRGRQARRVRTDPCIVLTFDDGPGFRLTPAILELLAEYDVRATFFMLGRNVKGREHIVRAVADRGHEIGTHSYDHLHNWKVWPIRALTDIRRGQQEMARVLKTDRVLPFRSPGGKLNLLTLLFLLYKRVPIYAWTLDMQDTWPVRVRSGERVEAALRRSGSAISLAHDFDRGERSVDNYVLTTLRAILDYGKSADIPFRTMAEVLSGPRRESRMPTASGRTRTAQTGAAR